MLKWVKNLVPDGKPRPHAKTSAHLSPQWTSCSQRAQNDIPKLCIQNVAFYFICTYLLWFKNKKQAIPYVNGLRLNLCTVLSFSYFEVAKRLLGGATNSYKRWQHEHTSRLNGDYFVKLLVLKYDALIPKLKYVFLSQLDKFLFEAAFITMLKRQYTLPLMFGSRYVRFPFTNYAVLFGFKVAFKGQTKLFFHFTRQLNKSTMFKTST